jgi:hypothetical protein
MKRKPSPASRLTLPSSDRPTAPAASYWIGQDRESLKALIASRRAQQRTATVSDITHDPMVAATAALMTDHAPRWKTT